MPAMLLGIPPLQATRSSNLQTQDSYQIIGMADGGRSFKGLIDKITQGRADPRCSLPCVGSRLTR